MELVIVHAFTENTAVLRIQYRLGAAKTASIVYKNKTLISGVSAYWN
ncbi:MAG: hypothetical protein ACIAQZ_10970 [Sedimentisphaeraceae bacterium JB056]